MNQPETKAACRPSWELWNEDGYLTVVERVIEHGRLSKPSEERTGTGTKWLPGFQVKYDLTDFKLPLFTTKKVPFGSVYKELLFFLKAKTHANWLAQRNCPIWAGNSTRAFLDKRGLTDYPAGQLGPVYGFQWRHWNGDYKGADALSGDSVLGADPGIDQLANLIRTIRTNPGSRRMLVVAWNPSHLDQMALPPCHVMFQVFCDTETKTLDLMMVQRSCDLGLGVPFNVASYATLAHMLANMVGYKAGTLIHSMGHVHVYLNHIGALQEQLKRPVLPAPTIRLPSRVFDLDQYNTESCSVEGYRHGGRLPMKMAV